MEVVFGQKERRKAEFISQLDFIQELGVQVANRARLLWIVIRDGKDAEAHWLLLNEMRDRVVPVRARQNNCYNLPVGSRLGLLIEGCVILSAACVILSAAKDLVQLPAVPMQAG